MIDANVSIGERDMFNFGISLFIIKTPRLDGEKGCILERFSLTLLSFQVCNPSSERAHLTLEALLSSFVNGTLILLVLQLLV